MNNIKMSSHRVHQLAQHGFAMIDVMIATLILAVGVIAFVNLENLSIKRSQQISLRLQATASAASLIETLRSNRGLVPWLIARNSTPANSGDNGNFIVGAPGASATNCREGGKNESNVTISISDPGTWCNSNGTRIYSDLSSQITDDFANNFQSVTGKAIMCLRAENAAAVPVQIRVTVVWKNSVNSNFTQATNNDCPAAYGDPVPNLANVDSIQSDISYYEIYTRI